MTNNNNNKKKKEYLKPQMAVMEIGTQQDLLVVSTTDQAGSKVNDDFYDDPGDGYLQVGFGQGTCKTPD